MCGTVAVDQWMWWLTKSVMFFPYRIILLYYCHNASYYFSSPVPCLRRVSKENFLAGEDDDGDGRFPGDAATMEKRKIEKVLYARRYLGSRFTLHDMQQNTLEWIGWDLGSLGFSKSRDRFVAQEFGETESNFDWPNWTDWIRLTESIWWQARFEEAQEMRKRAQADGGVRDGVGSSLTGVFMVIWRSSASGLGGNRRGGRFV